MSDLAQRCLELVATASVTKSEETLCEQMLAWAAQRFPHGRVQRWRHGFILDPLGNSPPCALFGHLDTVPPALNQPVEVREGRVYGCGASDMKAGVAVMMSLLEERPGDFWGVFYDREEGPYADNGLDPLLDLLPPIDLAIVLEPTNNVVQAGCVGGIQARLRFPGKRAHSARPWQGDNAIYRAIPLLSRLASRPRKAVEIDGLTFYEVMSATQAGTTNPANAVPERFEVNLNFRFAPGRSLDSALRELEEMVSGEAECEVVDSAPSGGVNLSQARLKAWRERHSLPIEPKQAWTDVARLTARGIPAVNFGPGDPAQAHQAGEWAEIAAMQEGLRLLRDL